MKEYTKLDKARVLFARVLLLGGPEKLQHFIDAQMPRAEQHYSKGNPEFFDILNTLKTELLTAPIPKETLIEMASVKIPVRSRFGTRRPPPRVF